MSPSGEVWGPDSGVGRPALVNIRVALVMFLEYLDFGVALGSPIPLRRLPRVVPVALPKGPGTAMIGAGFQRGSQGVFRLCVLWFFERNFGIVDFLSMPAA